MASAQQKITYTLRAEYEGAGELKKLSADLKQLQQIEAMQKAEESFQRTSAEMVTAKAKMRELAGEMRSAGGEAFAASYEKARKEVARLNNDLIKQKQNLGQSRAALREQGVNVGNLSGQYDDLRVAVDRQATVMAARSKLQVRSFHEIEAEVAGLKRAYETLERSGTASARELAVAQDQLKQKTAKLNAEMGRGHQTISRTSQLMGTLRSTVAVLAPLLAGISGAAFAKSVWDAGLASERLNTSFEAIYGSAERAGQEMEWLRAVSETLGVEYQALAESYRGVAASSKGTILEGAETRKIFLSVTEAARALSLTGDDTSGALNAIAQMMSKGKIQAEELRGQLGERLFGAFQLVAQAAGVSTEELNGMLERGEVGIDILSEFAQVLHKEYGPAALKASDSAAAAQAKLSNAWFDFKVALADNGFLEMATDGITRLTTALKDQQVQQAAISIVQALGLVANMAVRAGVGVVGFVTGLKAWIETVFTGYMRLGQGIAYVTDMLGITENAYESLKKKADAVWADAKSDYQKAGAGLSTMVAGFEETGKAAERSGDVIEKTFADTSGAAKKSADDQKKATDAALEEMRRKYQAYADEVMRLQDQIAGRTRDLYGELRDMARGGMSDIDAWQDQKAQAEEYMKVAEEAAQAGDFTKALEYADQAKQLFKGLNTEVKDGDRVLISQQEALKTAMTGVKEAGELGISVLQDQQDAAAKSMEELEKSSGFANLKEGMDEAKRTWLDNWEAMRSKTMTELDKVEQRIEKIVKDRSMNVYVNTVQKKAGGGMIGATMMAAGGYFRSAANGFHFPGYGGGDQPKNLVMAEDGEVMIRKESVRAAGLRAALAWNAGNFGVVLDELLSRFRPQVLHRRLGGPIGFSLPPLPPVQMLAGGGAVGGGSIPVLGHYTHDITFPGASSPVRVLTDRENAEKLERGFERMKRLSS